MNLPMQKQGLVLLLSVSVLLIAAAIYLLSLAPLRDRYEFSYARNETWSNEWVVYRFDKQKGGVLRLTFTSYKDKDQKTVTTSEVKRQDLLTGYEDRATVVDSPDMTKEAEKLKRDIAEWTQKKEAEERKRNPGGMTDTEMRAFSQKAAADILEKNPTLLDPPQSRK